MTVIKRNGIEVTFDKQKIIRAIEKAMKSVEGGEVDEALATKIAQEIENIDKTLKVEEIQDLVEKKLMASKYKDAAKNYMNYRYLRTMARSQYKELMDSIAEKLSAKNVQNQNANVDEASFGGRMGEANDVVTRRYALEYIVSPKTKANHENNEIYIHDLNAYAVGSHNCLSVPFDHLLEKGFNTRQTDVRPAQSINTAFQLVAVIFQLQSLQQFGGVSATHLDWTMVPYVRKSFKKHFEDGVKYIEREDYWMDDNIIATEYPIDDIIYKKHEKAYNYAMDMTKRECYQAVEGMYHNLNTLQSRSGNQLKLVAG